MRINANIAAVTASRNPTASNDNLGRRVDRPLHGARPHRAADDGAGLSAAEGLRAEIRNAGRTQRRAQDGISVVQTADEALADTRDVLGRLRQLSVRATGGDAGADAPTASDVDVLLDELRSIGQRATYGGRAVLADWTSAPLSVEAGGDPIAVLDRDLATSPTGAVFGAVFSIDLSTPEAAADATATIDATVDDIDTVRTGLGSTREQFERVVGNLAVAVENLLSSVSHLRSVDDAGNLLRATRARVQSDRTVATAAQASSSAPQSMLMLLQG